MTTTLPDNAEKAAVWRSYRAGSPQRTPLQLGTNPRVVILDPELNTGAWTFEAASCDPATHVAVALAHARHRRETINRFSDEPCSLPEVWEIQYNAYNVYEAASLGAPVSYSEQSVPATEAFLDEDRDRIFDVDITRPLELDFIRRGLAFHVEMQWICRDMRFEGRPVRVAPWAPTGTDGPLTVACNVRGTIFLSELIEDPDYADRLLSFLVDAAIRCRQALWRHWGAAIGRGNGMADDMVATLSPTMYRQRIMPLHKRYYEAGPIGAVRTMHLCGDVQRLLPMIASELDVVSFDTGFPVDHGALRDALGESVEILGGPTVSLLLEGTADDVYRRTAEILGSGIRRGGRFILREGNNLPPCVPLANLEAMYLACLEHGRFPAA